LTERDDVIRGHLSTSPQAPLTYGHHWSTGVTFSTTFDWDESISLNELGGAFNSFSALQSLAHISGKAFLEAAAFTYPYFNLRSSLW